MRPRPNNHRNWKILNIESDRQLNTGDETIDPFHHRRDLIEEPLKTWTAVSSTRGTILFLRDNYSTSAHHTRESRRELALVRQNCEPDVCSKGCCAEVTCTMLTKGVVWIHKLIMGGRKPSRKNIIGGTPLNSLDNDFEISAHVCVPS